MRKIVLVISILLISFTVTEVKAQTNISDIGLSVSVNDNNVQDGDVICSTKDGYKLCTSEYDSSIYGIVDSKASASVEITQLQNAKIVVSKGETNIHVTATNGNIKKGDGLTSSKIAGAAMLATKNGFIIGTSLDDYSNNDKNAVGTIRVSINIHPRTNISTARQNIVEILRNGLSGLGVDPISALRYILASAMVLISFAIGFIYFGRIARTGVEAIGRNPLAGIRIQTSVILNVVILLGVIIAGLVVAYLILAL